MNTNLIAIIIIYFSLYISLLVLYLKVWNYSIFSKINSKEKEKLKFLGLNEKQNILNSSITETIDYIELRNEK